MEEGGERGRREEGEKFEKKYTIAYVIKNNTTTLQIKISFLFFLLRTDSSTKDTTQITSVLEDRSIP